MSLDKNIADKLGEVRLLLAPTFDDDGRSVSHGISIVPLTAHAERCLQEINSPLLNGGPFATGSEALRTAWRLTPKNQSGRGSEVGYFLFWIRNFFVSNARIARALVRWRWQHLSFLPRRFLLAGNAGQMPPLQLNYFLSEARRLLGVTDENIQHVALLRLALAMGQIQPEAQS